MKAIEKELDALVQQLSNNQICRICGKRNATAIHHIIPRKYYQLRYELPNLLPVCQECHSAIHDKGLDVSEYIPYIIWEYLQERKKQSYKDFLTFEVGLSEKEYFDARRRYFRELLGGN